MSVLLQNNHWGCHPAGTTSNRGRVEGSVSNWVSERDYKLKWTKNTKKNIKNRQYGHKVSKENKLVNHELAYLIRRIDNKRETFVKRGNPWSYKPVVLDNLVYKNYKLISGHIYT